MNWYKIAQNLYNIPRKEYTPFPEDYDSFSEDEQTKFWEENRKKRTEWDQAMQHALATGKITPEQADERGYVWTNPGEIKPLPPTLYHVTTAKNEVVASQLKTRKELGQSMGKGLGGGESDTLSFTENLEVADGIYNGLLEAQLVAKGEKTMDRMVGEAMRGTNAEKPWIDMIKEYYKIDNDESLDKFVEYMGSNYVISNSYLPKTLEEFVSGPEGRDDPGAWKPLSSSKWPHGTGEKESYTKFIRKATLQEQRDRVFDFYKSWSSFREHSGGPLNPLFFLTDVMGLAGVPEEEISILEFRPKQGALGYQVSGLGEWRTWTGEAIELVRVIR